MTPRARPKGKGKSPKYQRTFKGAVTGILYRMTPRLRPNRTGSRRNPKQRRRK